MACVRLTAPGCCPACRPAPPAHPPACLPCPASEPRPGSQHPLPPSKPPCLTGHTTHLSRPSSCWSTPSTSRASGSGPSTSERALGAASVGCARDELNLRASGAAPPTSAALPGGACRERAGAAAADRAGPAARPGQGRSGGAPLSQLPRPPVRRPLPHPPASPQGQHRRRALLPAWRAAHAGGHDDAATGRGRRRGAAAGPGRSSSTRRGSSCFLWVRCWQAGPRAAACPPPNLRCCPPSAVRPAAVRAAAGRDSRHAGRGAAGGLPRHQAALPR